MGTVIFNEEPLENNGVLDAIYVLQNNGFRCILYIEENKADKIIDEYIKNNIVIYEVNYV